MKLKYFGEIDPKKVEEYYHHQVTIAGKQIELDLNFEDEGTDLININKVSKFLDDLQQLLSDAITSISNDYELGRDSETARDYLEHHLEILEPEEIQDLFGTKEITKELFMSKLIVERVGFYPEDADAFAIVDVTFKGGISNYLMAVTYDENRELSYISMDS